MADKVDVKKVLEDLADTSWSVDKKEKHKAIQLIIGLINNEDDELAKKFTSMLDKWTTDVYSKIVSNGKNESVEQNGIIVETAERFFY